MAEETDKEKKTKAPLIKRSHNEPETHAEKSTDQAEPRKVKVVMKKPVAVKKAQPKVVVSSPEGKQAGVKNKKKASEKEHDNVSQKETNETAGAASFTIAQRPAAAAGRVGGKLVGQAPHYNKGQRPPQARQDGARGQRNEGDRGGQGSGGGRGFGGGQRSGGAGGKPAFTPRQGGGKPGFGNFNRPQGGRGGMGAAPSAPIPEGKAPGKRKFLTKKPVYNRKEKELEMEEKLLQTKKKITHVANPVPKSIEIMEVISVSELARKMNLKASDLIQKLMSMGQMVTINQQIDADTATR